MTKEQKYEAMVKYLVDKANETELVETCDRCGLGELLTDEAVKTRYFLMTIGVEHDPDEY